MTVSQHTHLSAITAAARFSSLMTYCLALKRKKEHGGAKSKRTGCDQTATHREGAPSARKGVGGGGGQKAWRRLYGGWRGNSFPRQE